MPVSYKKLWKLLIDKDMKKKDLRSLTGVSTTTMSRLAKDENVSTEIMKSSECFFPMKRQPSLPGFVPVATACVKNIKSIWLIHKSIRKDLDYKEECFYEIYYYL